MTAGVIGVLNQLLSIGSRRNYSQKKKRHKNQAIFKALNLYFMFLSGPHKRNFGQYPAPCAVYAEHLKNAVFKFCNSHDMHDELERLNILFDRIDTLTITNRNSLVIFLICLSNLKKKPHHLTLYRTPFRSSLDFDSVLDEPQSYMQYMPNSALSFHDPTQSNVSSMDSCASSRRSPDNCLSFFGAFNFRASDLTGTHGLYSNASPLLWLPDDEGFLPFQEFRRPHTNLAPSASLAPSESVSFHGFSNQKTLFSGSLDRTTVWENADFRCCLKTSSYIDSFILDAIHGRISGCTTEDSVDKDCSSSRAIVPTWEKRGSPDVASEKPFLSESGAMATQNLLCAYRSRFPTAILPPSKQEDSGDFNQLATPGRLIAIRRALFRDLFNAHVGQASPRFQWDPDPVAAFFWQPKEEEFNLDSMAFHISVGCLRSCLAPHLIAATAYRRLDDLVRPNVARAPLLGHVHTALMHALSQWLRAYAVAMAIMSRAVSSPTTADLHSLSQRLNPLVSSLLLVAEVCGVLHNGSPNLQEHNQPAIVRLRGVRLLSYLAAWVDLSTHCASGRSAISHLFRQACTPFLQFLQTWVLEGHCDDPFNEFSITIDHRFDDRADISFWKHSVNLCPPCRDQQEDGLAALRRPHLTDHTSAFYGLLPPSFESAVLRCGLSLTLLRKIEPKHFIFNQCSHFPQLGLRDNAKSWDSLQSGLVAYEQSVSTASEQARAVWFQTLVEEENAKRHVLAQVVASTNAALARDKETSRLLREAEQTRKAKTLTDLETDVQERRAHLAAEEEHAKLADRQYLEEAQRRNFTEPRMSESILEEEREKLKQEYAAKTLEVDQRRELAELSCVKRSPLAAAPTNIVDTGVHANTEAVTTPPKPPLSPRPRKSPVGLSTPPPRPEPSPAPPCDKQTAATVARSGECTSEVDLLGELRQQFRRRNTRGRPPPDRIRDIIQPGTTMQWEADTAEGNKENNAQLQGPSSARVVNSPRQSRAKQVLYGPGLGPTCRPNTWRKPGNVEHLPDEEILAFSNELLEAPPSPPPYPSFETCRIDFDSLDRASLSGYLKSVGMTREETQPNSDNEAFPEVPFFYILDKSLKEPLQVQARILDRCLVEHFLTHLGLLDYLAFVRQIFFLEHSDIASCLLRPLFRELSTPFTFDTLRSVFDPETLNEALSHVSIRRPRGMCKDRLPFRLTRLQNVGPSRDDSLSFDSLAIVYEAPWPLNICLHQHVLAKYNSVFCELARVKHAIWALEAVYRHMRSSCQNRAYAYSGIFQASVWRHEMEQVVRCVDAYFATQAVKASWSGFLRRIGVDEWCGSDLLSPDGTAPPPPPQLTSVSTLDELCSAHEEYVDGVLKCCLVTGPNSELHEDIVGLTAAVHRFAKALLTGRWMNGPLEVFVHSSQAELESSVDVFRQHARSLRQNLHRRFLSLRSSGAQTELAQLINALGYE